MEQLKEFEQIIGYPFKDINLLKNALTHSSYANEHHLKKFSDNERLEFLGDAVLEIVSSEFLFLNYQNLPEGDLSKLRASLVCEVTLAYCAKEIHLGNYVLLGRGEDSTGGRHRKSILSDALEAVIGAVFLDGGLESAKTFILKYILTDIEHKKLFYDSKTSLQELVQAQYQEQLVYQLIDESGPDHNKTFKVEAKLGEQVIGLGVGHSKKAAEQDAAFQGILLLKLHHDNRKR